MNWHEFLPLITAIYYICLEVKTHLVNLRCISPMWSIFHLVTIELNTHISYVNVLLTAEDRVCVGVAAGNHTESLNFIHGRRFVCGELNDNAFLSQFATPSTAASTNILLAISISSGNVDWQTTRAIILMIRVSQSFRVLSDSAQIL